MTVVAATRCGRSIRAESVLGVTELESRTVPEVAAAIACPKVAKHFGLDTFEATWPGSTGSIWTMQLPAGAPTLVGAADKVMETPLDARTRLERTAPTKAVATRRGM